MARHYFLLIDAKRNYPPTDTGSAYQVGYGYDAYGRFGSVAYNGGTPFAYSYVAGSNLVDTVTQGSGYWRDYDHEAASNRLLALRQGWGAVAASALQSRQTYDSLGRRVTEQIAGTGYMTALGRSGNFGVHAGYAYTDRSELDSSGRYQLTTAWGMGSLLSGTERTYDYDPISNRTSGDIGGASGSYATNSLNQYSSGPSLASASYDGNGNLLSDGTRTYTYDGENRLRTVVVGGSTWTYTYDYLGRRVRKQGPSFDLCYLYDGWNLIAELNSSGTIQRKFVWGLDVSGTLQGAGGVGGLLLVDNAGTGYWPVYDASHNVIGLYDGSGGYTAAYEYDPFGNAETAAGSYAANNPFRYSTKYTDTETGLTYYGHRYYHPTLGRFINRDPIEEAGGINLYAFCGNDGVNRFDLLGMADDTIVLPRVTVNGSNGDPAEAGADYQQANTLRELNESRSAENNRSYLAQVGWNTSNFSYGVLKGIFHDLPVGAWQVAKFSVQVGRVTTC